jgi:hypothetical protein
MNKEQKLRAPSAGQPASELTRLKALWRTLAEDARSYWQELFVAPECTQAQIREKIFARLKINLRFDKQLNQFRDWELEQRALDLEEERQEEDKRRYDAEFGADNIDLVREKILKKSYARATAQGDFASVRKTVVQDLNIEKMNLDKRKLALLEQKAAAYDRAQAALAGAKESKGGITKETLRKIEAELNLL